MSNSPFIFLDPVIPPVFAGRQSELTYLNNALFNLKESLVIYGNDAIGKSSIISTIYTNLNKEKRGNIFPVKINAFDFIKAIEDNFLGITTHQICAAIWTKLLNRKYSELIEDSLKNDKTVSFSKEEEKTIKRIFRIVTSEKTTGTGTVNSEIGGEFYIKGSRSQTFEIINERKSLAPFEFLHLLEELTDIINSYGYTSILVFCDELNHLPEKLNTDILRNYFSIFSLSKIQFVIVVVNPEQKGKEYAQKLIESFNSKLEVGPFKSKENIDELINNSIQTINSNIIFSPECSDYLFSQTDGHPWWIQKICDSAFTNAVNTNKELVQLELIEKAFKVYESEIKIYKDKIVNGLPFRKYNLNY
jgi:Cdc6-like AAA superfamily ATPase